MTTILLVDDDEAIVDPERYLLEMAGYVAIGATSAHEALHIMSVVHVDLVFSDIRLGETDGIWLAQQINKLYPSVPVVLATAYASAQVLARGRWRILMKPYTSKSMTDVIVDALAGGA